MARLAHLFGGRKKNPKLEPAKQAPSPLSKDECRSFSKDQMRVLLFRECEWRGRKLLLDSQSIKTTGPSQQKCGLGRLYSQLQGAKEVEATAGCRRERKEGYTEVSPDGTVYQYLRPCPDAKMLGEMIFGSAPLTYDGSTIKIHTIRSPPQLMVTKIFPAPSSPLGQCGRDVEDSCSLQNSVSEETSSCNATENVLSQSVPLDLGAHFPHSEELEYITRTTPCSMESNESYGNLSTPEGSGANLDSMVRSGSYNSLQRRMQRNISTSIEFGFRRHCDSGNNHGSEGSLGIHKRTKLGMSVIVSLSEDEQEEKRFQSFFFNHVTLVESHINKLSATVEKAYSNRRQFVTTVMEGLEVLQQSIYDLYTAPRLDEPVWLSMMVPGERRRIISARFVAEFMNTLEQFDTKATNFFVSTLLTAVLTHHLAWVPTVTPAGIPPSQSFHKKHSAKWLDMFAKSHPYNPLWVQLGDLYGSLGFPRKLAKTVIVGKKTHVVRRMINIIGYFVRCSEVYETLESRVAPSEGSVEESAPAGSETRKAVEKPVPPPRPNRKKPCPVMMSVSGACTEVNDSVSSATPSCNRCGLSECVCRTRPCHRAASEGTLRNVGGNDGTVTFARPLSRNNGKVTFTIGDIPLVEICSEKFRQFRATSPEREAPVCTCGLHVIVKGEVKIKEDVRKWVAEGSTESLTGQDEPCSRCDSGFRSCEESTSNASMAEGNGEGKRHALAVRALDLGVPTAKVEHLRNVGRSVVCSSNAVVELESPRMPTRPKQRTVNMLPRDYNKLRFSQFERSNSMFDEYFDENVELKMLDDANFEAKLQTAKENFFGKKKQQEDWCTLRTVQSSTSLSDAIRDSGGSDADMLVSRDSLLEKVCGCRETDECARCFPETSLLEDAPKSPGSACGDVVAAAVEVPLPKSEAKQVRSSSAEFYCSFGRSLMADVTSHYVPDFALQGTTSKVPREKLYADLRFAVENPVIDEPISEAVCIVADTDLWSVELASSQSAADGADGDSSHLGARVTLSQLIAQMMETLLHLWKIHMSPEFCIMHLEDRLQELYFKSRLLTEHLEDGGPRDVNTVTSALAVDRSDLPLLMAVASTHAPRVTCTYGVSYR